MITVLSVMIPSIVFGADWSGSGTSKDPYKISSVADLQRLAKTVNDGTSYRDVYFVQTTDINLTAVLGKTEWRPIGTYGGNGFDGIYDGSGHKVSGIRINNSSDGQGLFGYVNAGTVRNVIVSDCDINAADYVGGLVGYLRGGTLTNSAVTGGRIMVSSSFKSGGGLVGYVNGGTITSCLVERCVFESNYSIMGGIAGTVINVTMSDCSVDASSFSGCSHMGGIIGITDGGFAKLSNNHYTSSVKGVKGGLDGKDQVDGGAVKGAVVTKMPTVVSIPTSQDVATVLQDVATVIAETPKQEVKPVLSSQSYFVWTNGVKKPDTPKSSSSTTRTQAQTEEPTDFMGKNFRFYSMCDWFEGMRFMVIPQEYDMLVNSFYEASTGKEVSAGLLRHHIMIYKGHETTVDNRVHVKFYCESNGKNYYYELPNGTFEEYCYGKLGVPTLAYLNDVDKARELLVGQTLLTRTQFFRVDTEYDGEGYREVKVEKNKAVVVKAVGVGTRSFPVKIIVEDENGNQFYQNVAMSKTNSGMRDDEFQVDNARYSFEGSFDYSGAEMAVSGDVKSYLDKTVHTRVAASMSSKGSGKVRDVKVPRFTGFIIDEIEPIKNTRYYTLTLRETETRRIYYKDVVFNDEDLPDDAPREDYFGHVFAMGEGQMRNTTLETRTAIREGRVIPGMSMDEVEMAVGEATSKVKTNDGITEWYYPRTNSVLVVQFDETDHVKQAKARASSEKEKQQPATRTRASSSRRRQGTPLK